MCCVELMFLQENSQTYIFKDVQARALKRKGLWGRVVSFIKTADIEGKRRYLLDLQTFYKTPCVSNFYLLFFSSWLSRRDCIFI